ncbi:MAG TPA: hypothetical protein DEP45_05615 [Armatimonadetes bacterium]|nr:hypothetical protein [Armatimonadota bacterium]
MPTILSLCDRTGTWPAPYEEAGYDVIRVEIEDGHDVRLLRVGELPPIHGVLCAPPCTHFASSGALHWKRKGDAALLEGLAVVDACLRVVVAVRPAWWCLENPVGRLRHYIGAPAMTFQPCDYGDPWTKKTLLWGDFNTDLRRTPVEPEGYNWTLRFSPGPERQALRSITPPGFARAFMEANP